MTTTMTTVRVFEVNPEWVCALAPELAASLAEGRAALAVFNTDSDMLPPNAAAALRGAWSARLDALGGLPWFDVIPSA